MSMGSLIFCNAGQSSALLDSPNSKLQVNLGSDSQNSGAPPSSATVCFASTGNDACFGFLSIRSLISVRLIIALCGLTLT